VTYAEMQTEYEKVDKEKWELLEALKVEHRYYRDALGVDCFDCPVCQLIRRVSE